MTYIHLYIHIYIYSTLLSTKLLLNWIELMFRWFWRDFAFGLQMLKTCFTLCYASVSNHVVSSIIVISIIIIIIIIMVSKMPNFICLSWLNALGEERLAEWGPGLLYYCMHFRVYCEFSFPRDRLKARLTNNALGTFCTKLWDRPQRNPQKITLPKLLHYYYYYYYLADMVYKLAYIVII